MNYLTHEQLDALKEYVRAVAYHAVGNDSAAARSESFDAMARAEHMLDIALLPPAGAVPTLRQPWTPQERKDFQEALGVQHTVTEHASTPSLSSLHCEGHSCFQYDCMDCVNVATRSRS